MRIINEIASRPIATVAWDTVALAKARIANRAAIIDTLNVTNSLEGHAEKLNDLVAQAKAACRRHRAGGGGSQETRHGQKEIRLIDPVGYQVGTMSIEPGTNLYLEAFDLNDKFSYVVVADQKSEMAVLLDQEDGKPIYISRLESRRNSAIYVDSTTMKVLGEVIYDESQDFVEFHRGVSSPMPVIYGSVNNVRMRTWRNEMILGRYEFSEPLTVDDILFGAWPVLSPREDVPVII